MRLYEKGKLEYEPSVALLGSIWNGKTIFLK